ncbi:hypothetical protein SELMODRAFT_405286 [Selaginella moellendorffii]|uniref:Uncharacterized protein n=1 Tax=Selaginella moellendorffii TaxID=88036 RepID=D8QWV4_SELML|nr:hypothetical protein SELMODRAFT_405286 [Selaginella moellendorffii]
MPNKASSSSSSGRHNKVFVLQRSLGSSPVLEGSYGEQIGIPGHQSGLVGVYVSEEQAYAAVIQRQVAGMEQIAGSMLTDLRKVVSVKGLSFKERYKKMLEWVRDCDWYRVADAVSFQIKECPLVPFEKVNESKLFDGVQDLQSAVSDNGSFVDDEEDDELYDEAGVGGKGGGAKKRRYAHY